MKEYVIKTIMLIIGLIIFLFFTIKWCFNNNINNTNSNDINYIETTATIIKSDKHTKNKKSQKYPGIIVYYVWTIEYEVDGKKYHATQIRSPYEYLNKEINICYNEANPTQYYISQVREESDSEIEYKIENSKIVKNLESFFASYFNFFIKIMLSMLLVLIIIIGIIDNIKHIRREKLLKECENSINEINNNEKNYLNVSDEDFYI